MLQRSKEMLAAHEGWHLAPKQCGRAVLTRKTWRGRWGDGAMTCVHEIWVGACPMCKPVHTSRDQAWHFDHPSMGRFDSKGAFDRARSEEHTSELQSQSNLVCRLLLEKRNNI